MKKIHAGILAGLSFAVLDTIPMFFMAFEDKAAAMSGAFINRFAIGLLIMTAAFPMKGWLKGLIIGLLLSVPDALITKAYGPILGTGIIGGIVIGVIDQRMGR